MPFVDLFAEADRQLTICNSCRYCEGYCPVWPALELRTTLTQGDLTHLANLCHDCRDCFTACMYTAPHEFDLNPPKVFTQLREDTYRRYISFGHAPPWLTGRRGVLIGFVAISILLVLLSVLTTGGKVFGGPQTGSAYELISHVLLIVVVTVPSFWAIGVLAVAAWRYWRDTHGPIVDLLRLRPWTKTLAQAATLRHMRGGGEQCTYPDNEPTPARRRYHMAVSYGFGLCFVSTTSAAFMENVLGISPPYDYLSVPVVTGTGGGIGMVIGCIGLVVLKRRSDPGLGTDTMTNADHGLLWALLILSVTGLLTLALRTGVLFGPILVIHLAAVVVAFIVAPYTKFVHWVFRLLAMYKNNLDIEMHPGR